MSAGWSGSAQRIQAGRERRRTATRAPQRIQRRRTKGWRMPASAIYVGRPTKWGNPCTLAQAEREYPLPEYTAGDLRAWAVTEFVTAFARSELPFDGDDVRAELRGHDLACFCPLDQPCHADVLLEMANRA